jgi:hypothetical protein
LGQEQPQPPPAPHFDIQIDLSGLANLIWQSFIDHIGEVGTAVWAPLSHWLTDGLRESAQALWAGIWGSSANIITQVPADLTYNLPAYRAIASDPVPLAVGGATLALVLLGLRTLLGSMVGRDHVVTHVTGRLIPAVFLTLAYPVLIVQGLQLLNGAASGLGQVAIGDLLAMPASFNFAEVLPFALLWLLLIFYGLRLLVRLAYSIFRLLVALVFGPIAIILWAVPQTEWITRFWLRELLAWSTTPLLVTACLAMALPLASGRGGFLAAAAFGIAGFQAAHDLAGMLRLSDGAGHGPAFGYARMAAGAASGGGGSAAAGAMRSYAASERAAASERFYGYD